MSTTGSSLYIYRAFFSNVLTERVYRTALFQHEITGRSLIRLNEGTLYRLGIHNSEHRQEIWREIIKLRLKTAILEIRDLEHRDT